MVCLLCLRQHPRAMSAAVPVVFSGTMIFVSMMVLGALGLCVSLAIIALRMKKKAAAALFALAFVFMMMMGYLSSKDFADPMMNWIGEGVNMVGQGMLLLGMYQLHKAGLARCEDVRSLA
jgi:uncharacterized membrane protein